MRSRPNPYRRVAGAETKTWLPDDAGKYSRSQDLRKVTERATGSRVLVFPDGHRVELLDQIGKGHWTTAHLGDDGWVYLFTRQAGLRDPAKDILTEFTVDMEGRPESIHFPWTECVGEVRLPRSGEHMVYRQPKYEKIPAGSANAKVAGALGKAAEKAALGHGHVKVGAQVQAVADSPVPESVKAAAALMADYMANWGDGWIFEFPKRNIMQDAEGNIVLLDVIFDAQALRASRAAQEWRVLRAARMDAQAGIRASRKNPNDGHRIREDQGDGFRIDTDFGFIQYRPAEGCNEVWWIESHRRGGGAKLMGLMLQHHPAEVVAWGATSVAGQAFRKKWHAAHPEVDDATAGGRVPFEGQFDPYDGGGDDGGAADEE